MRSAAAAVLVGGLTVGCGESANHFNVDANSMAALIDAGEGRFLPRSFENGALSFRLAVNIEAYVVNDAVLDLSPPVVAELGLTPPRGVPCAVETRAHSLLSVIDGRPDFEPLDPNVNFWFSRPSCDCLTSFPVHSHTATVSRFVEEPIAPLEGREVLVRHTSGISVFDMETSAYDVVAVPGELLPLHSLTSAIGRRAYFLSRASEIIEVDLEDRTFVPFAGCIFDPAENEILAIASAAPASGLEEVFIMTTDPNHSRNRLFRYDGEQCTLAHDFADARPPRLLLWMAPGVVAYSSGGLSPGNLQFWPNREVPQAEGLRLIGTPEGRFVVNVREAVDDSIPNFTVWRDLIDPPARPQLQCVRPPLHPYVFVTEQDLLAGTLVAFQQLRRR